MKNKRGFFGLFTLIGLGMIFAIILLIVIFLNKFEGIWNFISKYWWAFLIGIFLLVFHKQVKGILNFLLRKVGVKV